MQNKPVHVRVKSTGFEARLSREEWDAYPKEERTKFVLLHEGQPKKARKGEEVVDAGGAAPPVVVPPEEN